MNENANFVVAYEGYPEFLTQLLHRSILEKNRLFRTNAWSLDTGALDFYESLDFAPRFYSLMSQAQTELCDALHPHDSSVATCIETIATRQALAEYRRVVSICDGSAPLKDQEYDGR